MSARFEETEMKPGAAATDTVMNKTGTVLELGEEEALVRFPLLGDLWVPYGELVPGRHVIGEC